MLDVAGYPGAPEGAAEAFLKPDTVHNFFAQDLPEVDRWTIVATPASGVVRRERDPVGGPRVEDASPAGRCSAREDLVIPIDVQRRMAERAGATITEVDASHVSMVSQPDATLAAIQAAVASIS